MRVLVFGHNGQTGMFLANLCHKLGHEFFGVSRQCSAGIDIKDGDISNPRVVAYAIIKTKPDAIINLAAKSNIDYKLLNEHHNTIVKGNLNILQSVFSYNRDIKVFVTGSGLQFKNEGKPISANDPFEARDAYSMARIATVYQARFFRTMGMKVYVGYLFHHESILRSPESISKRTLKAAIEGTKIKIGDINVQKEWTFAGDVAKGILALVQQDKIFEATIGTGTAHPISEWLELCFKRFRLDWKNYIEPIPDYVPDFKILVSDPTIMTNMGWSCKSDLEKLLDHMSNEHLVNRQQ
jgi:GDPmannose 4,6-dehydratase